MQSEGQGPGRGRPAAASPGGVASERVGAGFPGADAQRLLDRRDEDLAVADLAGMGGLLDGLDGALDLAVVDHDLDLHLGQETHQVLGPAIDLGLALLSAETLDFAHRQARHANAGQGVAHLVELERLDDGGHEFHTFPLLPLRHAPTDWRLASAASISGAKNGPAREDRRARSNRPDTEAAAEGNQGGSRFPNAMDQAADRVSAPVPRAG